MYVHYIITGTLCPLRKRVAMHFLDSKKEDYLAAIRYLNDVSSPVHDLLGVLTRITESPDWDSLVYSDPYFRGLELVDDVEAFEAALTAN